MVKQIQCFEDSKGKIHKIAFDAHRADLAHLLAQSGDISEASATKFAERLAADHSLTEELIGALSFMDDARPDAPQDAINPDAPVYEDAA